MASTTTSKVVSRLRDAKPAFIYGTAWKKDETKRLVKEALTAGFRRVDTAAQPRHYQEHLVGEALREAYTEGIINNRNEIYVSETLWIPHDRFVISDARKVQTKFTTPAGQDLRNMPYDPSSSLDVQIQTSVASSMVILRVEGDSQESAYIDCLLLHSPLPTIEETLQAWKILESYVPQQIHMLGISNVTLPVLEVIFEHAIVKPSVVQNRFYHETRYDVALRAFCSSHDITYQSFWTLTGNPVLLRLEPVRSLARTLDVSPAIALYALVMDLGVEVLNGTTSSEHMRHDLEGIQKVCEWIAAHPEDWVIIESIFRTWIDPSTV